MFCLRTIQTCGVTGLVLLVSFSVEQVLSVVPGSDAGEGTADLVVWGDFGEAQKTVPQVQNVIQVAAGGYIIPAFVESSQSVVLQRDGNVVFWESRFVDGGRTNIFVWSNVVSVAVDAYGPVVLFADGTLDAHGSVDYEPRPPTTFDWRSPITNVVAISLNRGNFLALKADGTVFQSGDPYFENTITNMAPANQSNVVAVAAGGYSLEAPLEPAFSLALHDNGTVAAWGSNKAGQLALPVDLTNAVAIAAGYSHGVALRSNGTVATWGRWAESNPTPAGLTNVVAVAAAGLCCSGDDHPNGYCLALKADGTVIAWGTLDAPAGLTNVVAIAAGPYRALALIGNGPPRQQAEMTNAHMTQAGFEGSLPSECGRVYRLEYTSSLFEREWTALPLVSGNGGTLTLRDPFIDSAKTARFYRVQRW